VFQLFLVGVVAHVGCSYRSVICTHTPYPGILNVLCEYLEALEFENSFMPALYKHVTSIITNPSVIDKRAAVFPVLVTACEEFKRKYGRSWLDIEPVFMGNWQHLVVGLKLAVLYANMAFEYACSYEPPGIR
jgi:hypothetical protein